MTTLEIISLTSYKAREFPTKLIEATAKGSDEYEVTLRLPDPGGLIHHHLTHFLPNTRITLNKSVLSNIVVGPKSSDLLITASIRADHRTISAIKGEYEDGEAFYDHTLWDKISGIQKQIINGNL